MAIVGSTAVEGVESGPKAFTASKLRPAQPDEHRQPTQAMLPALAALQGRASQWTPAGCHGSPDCGRAVLPQSASTASATATAASASR